MKVAQKSSLDKLRVLPCFLLIGMFQMEFYVNFDITVYQSLVASYLNLYAKNSQIFVSFKRIQAKASQAPCLCFSCSMSPINGRILSMINDKVCEVNIWAIIPTLRADMCLIAVYEFFNPFKMEESFCFI